MKCCAISVTEICHEKALDFICSLATSGGKVTWYFCCVVLLVYLSKQFNEIQFLIYLSTMIEQQATTGITVQKATIHHVTTMLATSKNVLLPGHNQLLTLGTSDWSLIGAKVIIKVSGYQYWWLAGGYDLEIGLFISG